MSRRMQLPPRRLPFRPQVEFLESRNLLSFGPPNNFPVDANPLGVVLADLNGDGKLDAVTANYGDGTVSVLMGNGDGTFQPAQSYVAGTNPSTVAIGDFNGDHIPDLAVGHYKGSANTVSVLLGNGDGTFQAPTDYTVGNQPIWITAADLTGNGILDIVASNNNSDSISVLMGNGDGTFQLAVNYPVGHSPLAVIAADFNGDHIPDLAVANSGSNTVSILFGNGDGTFQPASNYSISVGSGTADIAAADFNGDGAPDLAVVSMGSSDVTILLNDGQGGFYMNAAYPVDATPIAAVPADFNSDGKMDLVIGYYNFTNTKVTTLLGNGDGTFQSPADYTADIGPV
ncbi:MAG TPA: VCBS repeat-containing protein, partial [Gemmataceae bacterium]|nr:VCBS repeat-containing protein [Gemmataceae bacterium]